MKNVILVLILLTGVIFISFNLKEEDPLKIKKNFLTDNFIPVDSKKMDANSISTWYRTNGSFNRDPFTGNAGFEWPKGSRKTARYASGIWLGCISDNDTLTAVAEYSYDYNAGYVDNSGNPQTDSTYRIYTITQNNINSYDYLHWPGNQGAYLTGDGKPYQMGAQTMFIAYTDGFPHGSGSTSLRSLNAQILQTNWEYNPVEFNTGYPTNPLSNTIFMEYRIINRSSEVWNNMWVGLWSDDDIGDGGDDKTGCDTLLNLGFTYNARNIDNIYGNAPPAVAFKFLRGSYKFTGDTRDTIKYFKPFGSNNIISKVGFKDEGMTVFNYYNGGSPQPSDPLNNPETYRFIKGLWRLGQSWISPSGDTTLRPYSGDPVTGTGWIQPGEADRKFLISTGPYYNINPGDTIYILGAQIIAKGNSNLNSITQLRNSAMTIQNFYENNNAPMAIAPSPKISSYAPGIGKIYLTWNDSAEQFSFKNILSGGTYKFQGYNIYQISTYSAHPSKDDSVLLKTFDIRDGIKNIYDSILIPPHDGIFYGVVQKGSDNGISKYIELEKDSINNFSFVNGSEYKFAVTAYYYDSTGGLYTYPKVIESVKSNIIKVVPQGLSPGTKLNYATGDTLDTDQRDLAVIPVVYEPLKLLNATYTSTFGGTYSNPNWTVTKIYNGLTTTLFENVYNFTGTQDSVRKADGLLFNHQLVRDSGIVKDPENIYPNYYEYTTPKNRLRGWTYEPAGKEWFTAPDTTAIKTAKIITGRQFQSRSLGISFPTSGTFRNSVTRIKANGNYFTPTGSGNPILNGGPLRKIQIVFGQNSMAYRFAPDRNVLKTDTNLTITFYKDMTEVPFSVFAADELDSTQGARRQLNVAFTDSDSSGTWNPDTTGLGGYEFTYILASDYSPNPNTNYITKNPGIGGTPLGFASMDIMYAWLPRVKSVNGAPVQWSAGDVLTVTPYRITRPDFVPGYPLKYTWTISGIESGNKQLASEEVSSIKVFPNPYYGFSTLELSDTGDKFIYVSHLPQSCSIYFYTLDGMLVKNINRNVSDPNNTLEKWDLKNDNGSYVASGMYIVYVDCKELGTKTLKIAVFTQ